MGIRVRDFQSARVIYYFGGSCMREINNVVADVGHLKFATLFKFSEFEQALQPYKDSAQYDAALLYYSACIDLLDSPRLLQPLALLKQALGELNKGRVRRSLEKAPVSTPDGGTAPNLAQIFDRLEVVESRLHSSVELMKLPATAVPKILHFVWLGGGLGEIQRDYINLWKQVLAGEGYKINLWYDSDAMLAHETNRLISEAAKLHSLQNGGMDSSTEAQLGSMYEARAIVLKQQMFAHINQAVANGVSADEARTQLLSRAYGQQAERLKSLKERNLQSVHALVGGDLQLRDLAGAAQPMRLQAIYDQEMRLRGNLAAGSDVVRLEALLPEGGLYADVDNLPPFMKVLGGVDISTVGSDGQRGILQLLLDHNPHWMPGRQAVRSGYTDYADSIPAEHRQALEAFARSSPALNQVFQPPSDLLARPYMLRAVREGNSLSNAWLMAHPGSPMLEAVMQRLRFNYQVVNAVFRTAAERGIAPHDDDSMQALAIAELEDRLGALEGLSDEDEIAMRYLADAAASYYSDGIRLEREGTIYLTGPAAMRLGMGDYEQAHFTPRAGEASRAEVGIEPKGTVSRSSEEELDHSWKENGADEQQWVRNEQQRFRDGRYTTRYAGDLDELLNHSTVEFELGWPLIEGRHVLLTGLLQRLAERLGKPFTQAMMNGHDGPVVFVDRLPLDFDDRQAIRNQDTRLRPPASLANEQTRSLALDEVLVRLGAGSLQRAHLSPLQRLTLGALLGVESMDEQSLLAQNSAMENLINSVRERGTSGRFGAIEQHLFQRRDTAFVAGLNSVQPELPMDLPSALSLKKAALAGATTLYEWGQQVAQIKKVALQEHREQVQDRLEQVLNQLEGGAVKLVPQDLLMHGMGDMTAGRCFPLALAMSAAITEGKAATQRLRERFYLAVLEPEHADSIAFLGALEEMRGVKYGDVGTPLGRLDLDQVTVTLEESVGTRNLMLNSDNHSMLVARTVNGTEVIYHFYDPNFGLFEFETVATFRAVLKTFFQRGMARHYAAYGEPDRPQFDLIDLQGERVADLDLSSGAKVAHLLREDALPSMPLRRVRQRLFSAHGQSLVENPHLASTLLQSDSHWWAEQVADVTSRLQEGHESVSPLVPLFESLEVTLEGTYRVSMLDPKSGEVMATVISRDSRLLRIKNYLAELFSTLAQKRTRAGAPVDPTEASAVHTLNAGFAVQALMNALRDREGEGRTLTTAVQWHAYVNYAQLVHGNLVDVAGLVGVLQTALRDERIMARTTGQVVAEALAPLTARTLGNVAGHVANEGVGAVLGLANVGFDIYQLANAKNDVEVATYGTQLGFDAASLALTGTGLAAAALGAGTAAAVLGGAGVILGGLAIGVTALAHAYAIIAEEAKAVGLFFDEIEQAHRGAGYRYDGTQGAWLPRPSLIIRQLDLGNGRMQLDSTRLYPLRDHFGVPEFEADYSRAINLSAELGYPDEMSFAPHADQPIVLPCTPLNCYRYEYKTLPFVSVFHDKGFDIARRLEKKKPDGQWLFLFSFYSFPSEYVVYRIYPDYRPTDITVKLDARERKLVVPVIPSLWRGKVSYRLQGGGGTCTLVLNPGVDVELQTIGAQKDRWIIAAPWARETEIVFGEDGRFSVKDCRFKVSAGVPPDLYVLLEGGNLFKVEGRILTLLLDHPPQEQHGQVLQNHLQELARAHRLVLPYTPIHDYLIPFEPADAPRYTTGWYDAREDRILYVRNDDVSADDAQLSVVVGESAFFQSAEGFEIWQVEANTGLLSHRYRLLLKPRGTSSIRSVEADGQGVVHVVQEYLQADGRVERFNYLIHDGQLWLSSVTRGLEPAFEALLDETAPLTDWTSVLGEQIVLKSSHDKSYATVHWQLAPYVSICWMIEKNLRDMAWIRTRDDLIIRPVPRRHRARGWADSIQNLNDLMLLTVADDSDVFVIYDRNAQTLCRTHRTKVKGQVQWAHRWVQPAGLKQIAAQENGYLASTAEGLSFEIDSTGEVRFAVVGEQWLKGRAQWWLALEGLAKRYSVERFTIVGVANATADARLHAWYVDSHLVLCRARQGDVRLLGLTPDRQAAWLFEPAAGQVWRQALIDPQRLDQAFGTAAQLLHAEVLPLPERQWAPWSFADVRIDGTGLLGTTLDGQVLQLHAEAQPVLAGVALDWVVAHDEHLIRDLKAMLVNQAHRPFISIATRDASACWYFVDSARLIRIAAQDLPGDYELLGVRRPSDVLLNDSGQRLIRGYPSKRQIGPLDYVQRNAEVLVIEGQVDAPNLLPLIPDGVRTLVVRMGHGSMKCHLSQALTRRLERLVIDARFPMAGPPALMSRLIWTLDTSQALEVGIAGDHLVLIDPDSGLCVLFRDACANDPALHGDVILEVKGLRPCQISTLARGMMGRKGGTGSVTLKSLIEEAKSKVMTESTI